MPSAHRPLAGPAVTTPRRTPRLPRNDEPASFADVAAGVHSPGDSYGETVVPDRLRLGAAGWAAVPQPVATIAGPGPCRPSGGAAC
jgi:hypothetical protein